MSLFPRLMLLPEEKFAKQLLAVAVDKYKALDYSDVAAGSGWKFGDDQQPTQTIKNDAGDAQDPEDRDEINNADIAVEEMIDEFENTLFWAQRAVLTFHKDEKSFTKMFDWLMKVASKSMKLGNYFHASALIAALDSILIKRTPKYSTVIATRLNKKRLIVLNELLDIVEYTRQTKLNMLKKKKVIPNLWMHLSTMSRLEQEGRKEFRRELSPYEVRRGPVYDGIPPDLLRKQLKLLFTFQKFLPQVKKMIEFDAVLSELAGMAIRTRQNPLILVAYSHKFKEFSDEELSLFQTSQSEIESNMQVDLSSTALESKRYQIIMDIIAVPQLMKSVDDLEEKTHTAKLRARKESETDKGKELSESSALSDTSDATSNAGNDSDNDDEEEDYFKQPHTTIGGLTSMKEDEVVHFDANEEMEQVARKSPVMSIALLFYREKLKTILTGDLLVMKGTKLLMSADKEATLQVLQYLLLEATMSPSKFVEKEFETLLCKSMCFLEKYDSDAFRLLVGIESMLLMWHFTHSKWGMKERLRAVHYTLHEVFNAEEDETAPELMRVLLYSFLNRIAQGIDEFRGDLSRPQWNNMVEVNQFILECVFSYHAACSVDVLRKLYPDKKRKFGLHVNERGECPDRVLVKAVLTLSQKLTKVLSSLKEGSNVASEEKRLLSTLRRQLRSIEDLFDETVLVMDEIEKMMRPDLIFCLNTLLKPLEKKWHSCLRRDSIASMMRFYIKGKADLSGLKDNAATDNILPNLPSVPAKNVVYRLSHEILFEAAKKQGYKPRHSLRNSIKNGAAEAKKIRNNLVLFTG